jgi:competence protein ComEC
VASFGFCWLALWRGALRLVGVPMIVGALHAGLSVPPPDMLITADARLIALRTGEGVFVQSLPGARAFDREMLLRQFGTAEARTLPSEGGVAGGTIVCTPAACRFRPRADTVEAVLLRTAPPPRGARRAEPPDATARAEACGRAALVVAAEPIRPRCVGSIAVDRFTVWREGAQSVRLGRDGARVLSDRAWRGDRRWVPAPPIPGRPDPTLPLAPREEG